ncbi:Interferon-induced 6-16 family protein [Oceanospirillum multiglobuliferum]|uniref:hypothetical protein n=1 Tax=Oceanospirillum TaxID=965 RepID=UPI000991FD36|nr:MULTISPECIES: hypothetical protein [Oceanospirillum]SKA00870.1 Interferon-induced 6-16 family protein [Oceanospirillum multiglobuliferum]
MTKNTMSKAAAARIQSATAVSNGGSVPKGSFAARAQSAASKSGSTPPPNGPSKTGNPSGGGRGNNPPKSK